MGVMLAQGCIHVSVKLREVTLIAIKLKGALGQSTGTTQKYVEMKRIGM